MTLGEVLDQLPEIGNADGFVVVLPVNLKYKLPLVTGMARCEVFKPFSKDAPRELRLIFQALRSDDLHPERLLEIRISCRDRQQNIGALCEMFEGLIERFGQMPYENRSGATRY